MRLSRILGTLVVLTVLAGCATVNPDARSSLDTTTTPTAPVDAFAAATPVEPADYGPPWYDEDLATVNGVDFESPDHTIHCGIYDPFYPTAGVGPVAPFVGCVPNDVKFEFPAVMNDGEDYGRATAITQNGMGESAAVWMSDQEFAFGSKALAAGTSLTWSTVTCASLDGGIRCLNSASGYGFFLSHDRYEVDKEAPEQFHDDYVQDPANLYSVSEGYGEEGIEWLTPSGNVACAILSPEQTITLECRAAEHSWTGTGISIVGDELPQPTSSADATYLAGQVLSGSGTESIGVLPYGHFVHWGDFRCVSLDTGLTCENWNSRHGFTISKSKLETH